MVLEDWIGNFPDILLSNEKNIKGKSKSAFARKKNIKRWTKLQKKYWWLMTNPALQNLICRFFSYNDYITESALDSKSARQILIKFKPDLVILDVNLPDDTGLNLCQEISRSNAIVVMLSSMKEPDYVLDAFAKGADDYITKPFNLQILKAKNRSLIKKDNNLLLIH